MSERRVKQVRRIVRRARQEIVSEFYDWVLERPFRGADSDSDEYHVEAEGKMNLILTVISTLVLYALASKTFTDSWPWPFG